MRCALMILALAFLLAACASDDAAPAGADAPQVQLADVGDPVRGRAYAQDACASCHAIGAGESSPDMMAPSFEELANTPGMTAIAVRAWLNSPHENMPHLIVEPERADDVAAYILTLEHRD